MAVYTVVTDDEARVLIQRLGLGPLTGSLRGIHPGIENSNYYVDSARGAYVLTVFERLDATQLPYYLLLMKHLAGRGIPVPDPQANADGTMLFELHGKPAALLTRLPGSHRLAPELHHVEQVGAMLARLHLAAREFPHQQPHLRGLDWCAATVPVVLPHVDAERATLLREELDFQQAAAASAMGQVLPRGPIHADLFRDNVMFDGLPGHERLTGVLDFFFAGTDAWGLDVAICLNDWCTDLASGRLDEARAAAFVAAYARARPLTPAEHRLMPALLRAAALRFWLSRLWDLHLPRDAALLQAHDPAHFERVLRERIATPWHPPQ
ncbi:MAG: homoserine kinase [Rubrivivax sp.]